MSVNRVSRLAFAVAAFMATPVLAGPAGSGLAFTEEVARKRAVVKVAQADQPCMRQAVAALEADGAVRAVKVDGDVLHVTFKSVTADRDARVRQEVDKACGAESVVGS